MRNILVATLASVLLSISAIAGNRWINPSQEYYTVKVVRPGIYRIAYADLQRAGISIADFDPRNLQIFKDGTEIPIYVNTEGDGIFHSTDYIEFYGAGNDGKFDEELYRVASDHVNPYYSLYNDTATYFLTWNRSLSNKRFETLGSGTGESVGYCLSTKQVNFTNRFNYTYSGPDFHAGEGWVGPQFSKGETKSETVALPGYYNPQNVATECEYSISTVTEYAHILNLSFAGNDTTLKYYGFFSQRGKIVGKNIGKSQAVFSASIPNGDHASTDVQAFSFLRVTYPRDLASATDTATWGMLPQKGSGTYKLVPISGLQKGSAVLYDLTNETVSYAENTSGSATFVVKNSKNNQFIAFAQGHYIRPSALGRVSSRNSGLHSFADFSLVQNQGNYVVITHPQLWDVANEYADYRALQGFSTVVVDINELYNQFGFGIGKHPIGMRHFAKYAYEQWNTKPEYIFIIGKGAHAVDYRSNKAVYSSCMVPAAGSPSSDMMTFAGISGAEQSQVVAVGRLAAHSNDDVRLYLSKVKEHENQATGEWMKNVLHFGGGATEFEQKSFKNYLASLEQIVEGEYFGGTVHTTLKNSGSPIEITKSDIVRNKIEEGVSVMTFFGHASSGSFDQSIDEPINFNNRGKYPFILANSCYSGDIFNQGANSVSERWIFIENRGAIAFLASVGPGRPYPLYMYSNELYNNFSRTMYGMPIGKCMQQSVNAMVDRKDILSNIIAANDFNLHGDPAIKVHSHALPDIAVSESSIVFEVQELTAETDSFTVFIAPVNIGKSFPDTVAVKLKRYLPDGSEQTVVQDLRGLYYRDTLAFTFLTSGANGSGYNKLELVADADNELKELSETNNSVSVEFYIASRQLVPAYPEEFAIIPVADPILYASTLDAHNLGGECYFELDTQHDFSSGAKKSATLPYNNSVIAWEPGILSENTTYYWRVGAKTTTTEDIEWNESSFRIELGKTGWAQYGYGQMRENDFTYIEYNASHQLQFTTSQKMLTCTNVGSASSDAQYNAVQYRIDGVRMGSSGYYANPYLTVAVIDSVSLEPWDPDRGDMGHANYQTGSVKHYYFDFRSDIADQRKALATFLRDSVPAGNYVLMYTFISGKFKSWEDELYTAFEELGANSVRSIENNYPYIFFVQKGYPSSAREVIGASAYASIDLSVRLKSNAHYGYVLSPYMGTTPDWQSAHCSWAESMYDSTYTSLVGITQEGDEFIVAQNIANQAVDLQSVANAAYLQFKTYVFDKEEKTPPQFSYWKVYYTPLPETALSVADNFAFHADTLSEGDTVILQISSKNISGYAMDSLLVRYSIKNENNKIEQTHDQRLGAHAIGSVATGSFALPTAGFSGRYSVKAEFNPENEETGLFDQPEKYHFNNSYEQQFYVKNDGTNPLLTVRFDGIRILDRDIVSAKPVIEVEVSDENDYFFIDDTSLVELYMGKEVAANGLLKSEGTASGCDCRRIYFNDSLGNEQVVFEPATAKDKKAVMRLAPQFTEDGIYVLQVNATDKNGNQIADSFYEIRFQVIVRSSITHLFNYPNPFSTSTRFIFTLTGSELPDDLRIQIMTISGKLVREIGLAELGAVHIGNNITNYAWDGTDMFGDRLANGVYFYRVFSSICGKAIEHRNTTADNFFTKGYGKLVIMR